MTTSESVHPTHATTYRVETWKEWDRKYPAKDAIHLPIEKLPPGVNLPRHQWTMLNQTRAKVSKTKDNLMKWGLAESNECDCGKIQTMQHILQECDNGPKCSDLDLLVCNDDTITWLEYWSDKI